MIDFIKSLLNELYSNLEINSWVNIINDSYLDTQSRKLFDTKSSIRIKEYLNSDNINAITIRWKNVSTESRVLFEESNSQIKFRINDVLVLTSAEEYTKTDKIFFLIICKKRGSKKFKRYERLDIVLKSYLPDTL